MSEPLSHESVQPEWERLFGVRLGLLPRHKVPQYGTVRAGTLGLVSDYYDWTTFKTAEVPNTYAELDDGWESLALYFVGESESDVLRLRYACNKIEAAIRHATGGGRYDADTLDWVLGPFISIVQGPERDVAVAPIVEEIDDVPDDEVVVGVFARDSDGEVESVAGYSLPR